MLRFIDVPTLFTISFNQVTLSRATLKIRSHLLVYYLLRNGLVSFEHEIKEKVVLPHFKEYDLCLQVKRDFIQFFLCVKQNENNTMGRICFDATTSLISFQFSNGSSQNITTKSEHQRMCTKFKIYAQKKPFIRIQNSSTR